MKGLQIYTVRRLMTDADSMRKTVREIRDMGYECIQLAGDINTIERGAQVCAEVGMPVVGILTGVDTCENETERLFTAAILCGAEDIGISGTAKDGAAAEDLVRRANAFAKTVRERGFSFSYHNHSYEFIRTESGKTVMDILIKGFDRSLIDLMPDTYWLQHGGADIRKFIEDSRGRIKILHLKDMKRTADGVTFAELGRGNLNLCGIVETARAAGVKHYIVEQDSCDGDPLDSARVSIEYLNSLL